MSVRTGRYAKITVYNNLVAEMGQYTLSGFNRDVLEHTSFGSHTKTFIAGHVDGGEITLSGYFDPTDTNGQRVLEDACENGTIFQPHQIKVFISETEYFSAGVGGTMFVTKAKGVTMEKYGIASTQFTIKVCGTALTLYLTSGSLSVSPSPSNSPSFSPSKSPSESPSVSPSASPST
jgi:hypothetical protein